MVHGINTEMVKEKGMDTEYAIRGIMKTLGYLKKEYPKSPLICVNAPYDVTITDRELRRYTGFNLSVDRLPFIIDTLTCDRKLDPYRPGRRTLTATSAAYGVTVSGAHQAKNDVIASIALIRAMAKKFPGFGSCSLSELQIMQAEAHNDWADQFESYKHISDPEFRVTRGWPIVNETGS
jgi:DNA polymerase-3 subunit epsilon